jgi:hypothetical protein
MDAPQRILQEEEDTKSIQSEEQTLEDPKTPRVKEDPTNLTWWICLTDSFLDEIEMGADR